MHKQQKQRLLSSNRKLSVLTPGTRSVSGNGAFRAAARDAALFLAMWLSVLPLGTPLCYWQLSFPCLRSGRYSVSGN
jgi:hypothetical protein